MHTFRGSSLYHRIKNLIVYQSLVSFNCVVINHQEREIVSTSSPLMSFGELNGNTIKGLTSLLSVEYEIKYIAYTWIFHNKMYQRFNKKASLLVFHMHGVEMKPRFSIVVLENYENKLVWRRQQYKWNWWNGLYVMGYHSIMRKQAYLANDKRDMSERFWIGLKCGLLCMIKKSLIVNYLWSRLKMNQEYISVEMSSKD